MEQKSFFINAGGVTQMNHTSNNNDYIVLQLVDPELSSIINLPRSWCKFVTVRLSF